MSATELNYVSVNISVEFSYPSAVRSIKLNDKVRTGGDQAQLIIEMWGDNEQQVREALAELRSSLAAALIGE